MTISVSFGRSEEKSLLASYLVPLLSCLLPTRDAGFGLDTNLSAAETLGNRSKIFYFEIWAHLLSNDDWANAKLLEWYKHFLDLQKNSDWMADSLFLMQNLTSHLETILGINFSSSSVDGLSSVELCEWKSSLSLSKKFESPFLWSFRSSLLRYRAASPAEVAFLSKLETFERDLKIENIPLKILWRFIMVSLLVNSTDFANAVRLTEVCQKNWNKIVP
eukprot:Gregarina_sp_Poly_1__8442@NODE_497_length_7922_cov_26_990834_g53_i1_p3_GENE_NODE_497_length_7922_cov_26_990834_g53_i1NODE_497_length_7922_cov_26_990834_g53_i1_p3_ORF_typecomplete_len219_score37_67AbiJ_NTD3/PF18860_1/0_09_NODE_497_length_7922_cov_26_990834_g53_i151175773